jgi:hypothetical protein
MVTLDGLLYCGPRCIWSWGCGNPEAAVEYFPDDFEQRCCQFCAGCGERNSPHLGVAGCMVHGEACFTIGRWFLRTKAALDFCRLVWARTGKPVELGDPIWCRALELWGLEQYAGADGRELYERVMSELAE